MSTDTVAPLATLPQALARPMWGPLLLCLLLGFGLSFAYGPLWLPLRLSYLLPLVAVWWARRDGPGVALLMALLSLLPDISLHWQGVTLSYGHADATCVIAAALALAATPSAADRALAATLHPRRRTVAVAAAVLWVLVAADGGGHGVRSDPFAFAVDTVMLPAVGLMLVAVDWRRVPTAVGRMPSPLLSALLALALLATTVRLGWSLLRDLAVSVGSTSASSLVPIACLAAALCGWLHLRTAFVVVGAAALVEQALIWTIGPFSRWALEARSSQRR